MIDVTADCLAQFETVPVHHQPPVFESSSEDLLQARPTHFDQAFG